MARTIDGWIARDENGELYMYDRQPILRKDGTFIAPSFISSDKFKEIGPRESRKITITIEG